MAAIDLNDSGITIKSFQEIKNELVAEYKREFPNIDLNPSSVDGHHVSLEAIAINNIAQAVQAVVNNLDENKATGTFLDILGRYKGLNRLSAEYSQPTLEFTNNGNQSATISVGDKVTYSGCPFEFSVLEETEIAAGESENINVQCDYLGYVQVITGEWEYLENTPSDIVVVCNVASSEGRNAETDDEYRKRLKSADISGLCTMDAMKTFLRNRINPNVDVQENVDNIEKNGIEPHSYRVSVPYGSGTNDEVAQAIWECKPAGIKPSGNVTGVAVDVAGNSHEVKFIIPQSVNFYVRLYYTRYNEEAFPSDGVEKIKQNVYNFAQNEYHDGKDIIPFRIGANATIGVSGISGVRVQVSTNGTTFTDDPIAISNGNFANIPFDNIYVSEVF